MYLNMPSPVVTTALGEAAWMPAAVFAWNRCNCAMVILPPSLSSSHSGSFMISQTPMPGWSVYRSTSGVTTLSMNASSAASSVTRKVIFELSMSNDNKLGMMSTPWSAAEAKASSRLSKIAWESG